MPGNALISTQYLYSPIRDMEKRGCSPRDIARVVCMPRPLQVSRWIEEMIPLAIFYQPTQLIPIKFTFNDLLERQNGENQWPR
jgi:hypothetical protein